MKGKELGKLILDGLLIAEDGRLIVHNCSHVGLEGIHILADEDLVLLGLIPVRIKSSSEVCTWSSRVVEGLIGSSSGDGCGGGGWVEDCPTSP